MKRYKVTTFIEVLDDPEKWVNPASGKVEAHKRMVRVASSADPEQHLDQMQAVIPPWVEVTRFGSDVGVDAESFIDAMPALVVKINEGFQKVQEFAPLVDLTDMNDPRNPT